MPPKKSNKRKERDKEYKPPREQEEDDSLSDQWSGDESPRPKKKKKTTPPVAPPKKKTKYVFTEKDIDTVEAGIIKYGLNYSSIHDHYFRNKTSLNQVKAFINSEEMLNIKTTASEGIIFTILSSFIF